LWFESQAEEAAKFYTSIFQNSQIGAISHYSGEASKVAGRPEGSVLTVSFQIAGQSFLALNGGPLFKFTEAVSFVVNCDTQAEIDWFWEKLSDGGEKGQCGWLKDRYGLSWQIVPAVLAELLGDKDPKKTERVMNALLQMTKLDISALWQAYKQ